LPLDPELADALAAFPVAFDPGTNLRNMDFVRTLRSTLDLLQATGGTLPTDERVIVENGSAKGPDGQEEIPVRVYRPHDGAGEDQLLPGLVFFHGGAFVLGDLYSEELRCLGYAAEARCVVVSVGYRLAPDHRFPAAVHDAYAALEWTASNAAGHLPPRPPSGHATAEVRPSASNSWSIPS
jgi:acetyl esterase/lipase